MSKGNATSGCDLRCVTSLSLGEKGMTTLTEVIGNNPQPLPMLAKAAISTRKELANDYVANTAYVM